VATQDRTLGAILSSGGRTLYHTSAERRDVVACTGACALEWPPLVVAAKARPVAGSGVRPSLLGTVKRPDGRMQVTYRGLPLYFFSGDKSPGEAKGEGAGGLWHAIAPSGAIATARGAPSASASGSGAGMGTGSSTTTGSAPSAGVNPGMWCAANPNSCVNGVPRPT
jgi:predicted lipoprotein with Yx(FWY)xxD motif